METTNQTAPETQALPKNMKRCKTCGQPIAKTAKKCPHCGAKNRRPIYCSKLFWLAIIIVAILVAMVITGNVREIPKAHIVNNYGEIEELYASELEEKADGNSIAFGQTYRGAAISYTGVINEVDARHTINGRQVECGVLVDNFYVEFADQETLRFYQPGDEVTVTGFLGDARCVMAGDIYLWLENGATTITKAK